MLEVGGFLIEACRRRGEAAPSGTSRRLSGSDALECLGGEEVDAPHIFRRRSFVISRGKPGFRIRGLARYVAVGCTEHHEESQCRVSTESGKRRRAMDQSNTVSAGLRGWCEHLNGSRA
jgi:hypothetical protein